MIELKNIQKYYKDKPVLTEVNLNIADGAFVWLKGNSGSGKSTLLSIIGGLEPATYGQVIINGKDVESLKGKQRTDFLRHTVGFIFQGFYLQPQLTVAENIALSGIFAGVPKAEREKRVAELATRLSISEILASYPAMISGGQAERACIARALFMNPQIILADEPTNNLDPQNVSNVLGLLYQVWQAYHITVIVASHDPNLGNYAQQIVSLGNGRAILSSRATAAFAAETSVNVGTKIGTNLAQTSPATNDFGANLAQISTVTSIPSADIGANVDTNLAQTSTTQDEVISL